MKMELSPSNHSLDANSDKRRALKLSFQQQQQAQQQQMQVDAMKEPLKPGIPLPEKTK